MINFDKKIDNLLRQAEVVAQNSKDKETKVGCILVNKSNLNQVTSGYNGAIKNGNDNVIPHSRNNGKSLLHAEANAIFQAAKSSSSIKDCIAIVTLSPCISCARKLWQCDITEVYFRTKYKKFEEQLEAVDIKFNVCYNKDWDFYKLILEAK